MENYPLTKEQQFKIESQRLTAKMDAEAEEKRHKLETYDILLNTMREIAVSYPEDNNSEQDKLLCKYFIAKAQETISKVESNIHPVFTEILNNFFPPSK